jgi:hypothetical protein
MAAYLAALPWYVVKDNMAHGHYLKTIFIYFDIRFFAL